MIVFFHKKTDIIYLLFWVDVSARLLCLYRISMSAFSRRFYSTYILVQYTNSRSWSVVSVVDHNYGHNMIYQVNVGDKNEIEIKKNNFPL